jgi:signal-transduction protein with cAMP-binding, CBS, and nucleotidyltransferase domain
MRRLSKGSVELPVRTLRTSSLAATCVTHSVGCPSGGSVPLGRCTQCSRLDEVVRDRDGRARAIRCQASSPAPSPPRYGGPPDPQRTPVSLIMTHDVCCITCDFSLEALAALFLDEDIGAVPVIDYEGCPIGMLTKTHLVRRGNADRVIDLMSPLKSTLRETDSLAHAAALMVSERLHHLVVVDARDRVVGMLSSFDFARWLVFCGPR